MTTATPGHYSTEELLDLRGSISLPNSIINKLNNHPDLACILQLPEQALKVQDRFPSGPRGLADVTNGRSGRQLGKRQILESSGESEYQTLYHTNPVHAEVQWNFRRRDASDRSSQPHSAPTDIAAQQSENFQRFYRAVVSPTHVRVTAGGRIVPNTRTVAPPLFDWNAEKFHFESKNPEVELGTNEPQSNSWFQSAPPPPVFPPLVPAGFLPSYSLLQRVNTIPVTTMAPQPASHINDNGNQHLPQKGDNAGSSPKQIKLSPPTQFDQTKPFMFNGQLVYPVPPGFQPPPNALPLHMSMFGNSGYLPQNPMSSPAGFYPAQFSGSLAGVTNPFIFSGQQFPMAIPNTLQPLEHAPALTPYHQMLPPTVSISDFIKSQLQILQASVKQIEHQLANNTQLDATFMEHQRSAILNQISNMEALLETHLAQESKIKSDSRGGNNQNGLGNSMTANQESTAPSKTASSPTVSQTSNKQSAAVSKSEDSTKSNTKTGTTPPMQTNEMKKQATRSESTSKSRLTLAAAMAPPFQPRTQTAIAQASQTRLANEISRSAVASPMESVPFETQAQIESRLLAKSSTDWGSSGFPQGEANATRSRTQSVQESSSQSQKDEHTPSLQKYNTFHGQTNTALFSPPIISPGVKPYLVGSLPRGIHVSQAKSTDLTYSRALTGDEIRARYLYWGKAPRSVMSGLPKFDGKDFYPASPVKQDACLASATPSEHPTESQLIAAADPQLNFEKLFDSPTESPNQPISGKVVHYSLGLAPIQQSHFGSPDIVHGTLTFPTGGPSGWSTNAGRAGDIPQQPQTPPRPIASGNLANTSISEDFSNLFLERGVPGYKSPSPIRQDITLSTRTFDNAPVTPKNKGSTGESVRELNNGNFDSKEHGNSEKGKATDEPADNETSSNTSTVQIHLPPHDISHSPKPDQETTFAERVENFRSVEQQTLFLQNMLKNTQTQMSAPLSGTISSATAQGYLPQYRGSAAASLAPTMVNLQGADRESERSMAKAEFSYGPTGATSSFNSANFLADNLSISGTRLQRPVPPPTENMGAEGYMRYLSQKDDTDNKGAEKLTNTESGTGPISGSDW